MARGRRPTTDSGTVVAHLVLVGSFGVLLWTGLRIGSDDPAASWLAILGPLLPVEHLWFRHSVAATVFTATLTGYAVYVVRARLTARVRLDGARLKSLLLPGKVRWAACGALLHWGIMLCLVVEVATGILLFLDFGGLSLPIHLWTTAATVLLIALHVACHAAIGGLDQLARVLRPSPLVVMPPPPDLAELLAEQLRLRDSEAAPGTPSDRGPAAPGSALHAHPAALAIGVAMMVSLGALGLEQATRPGLAIIEIKPADAPVLDGDLSDPVWMRTKPASIQTTQGGDFGGTGQSLVEVRAVHDGTYAYFAFVWTDPTRSLKHLPLLKTDDGWQLVETSHGKGDESRYHEDKFSVLLAPSSFPLIGGAIHLTSTPRKDRPPSSTGRGLHYTLDGIADVWVWRASHGGPHDHIDNCHFGAAVRPTLEQAEGRTRYPGGFALDPGAPAWRANAEPAAASLSASEAAIRPWRLPRDLAAARRAFGRVSDSTRESESENARWWMTEAESIPYSPAADARVPVGTLVPGVVAFDKVDEGPTRIRGFARWAAGRWTLELSRRLYTGSDYDLPIKTGTLMWVAAFDHAETRHTRHLRPLRLEVQ